jgi:hypothetical protein
MFGYFRLEATGEFTLLIPARWHRQSTFEWLRQFSGPLFRRKATYKLVQKTRDIPAA